MTVERRQLWRIVAFLMVMLALGLGSLRSEENRLPPRLADGYLILLENFAGWCEEHWNENDSAFDAKGTGVTWPRGNGGVCITYAVLLTEFPERQEYSPRKIRRETMLDHVRRAIRSVALANRTCTHPDATKSHAWGGPDKQGNHWQAPLETMHWVVAAHMLADQLDVQTLDIVRQVATSEADLCMKQIPQGKRGNTAADDCCWNAGLLGVCASIYSDDPRSSQWTEWANRWALNIEARDADRTSDQIVDGRPLKEWLVSTQVFPDLTLENHGFWDLPYQVCFAAMAEPMVAHAMCKKPIPESYWFHAEEEGDQILKWLVLLDGDLLCPQGLDWAERDVQHQWAFTELGIMLDLPWARAAEARCLRTLLQRQAAFHDGSLHALDFGYQTDLANCWSFSFLMHKYLAHKKHEAKPEFTEPKGSKVFPYVNTAVYRAPDMVSSVSWYGSRPAIMVVPNNAQALGEYPSITAYRGDIREGRLSGVGCITLKGDSKPRAGRVDENAIIARDDDSLMVSFQNVVPGVATQNIDYCALATGDVIVFSRWQALNDLHVAELVDHTYYWLNIPGWLPVRTARREANGTWSIADVLQMTVFGSASAEADESGVKGALRRDFMAKRGDVLQDTVCVYRPIVSGRSRVDLVFNADEVRIGNQYVIRRRDQGVSVQPLKPD